MLTLNRPHLTSSRWAARATAALLLCGVAAQAQVYRVVGPDGKVTYSDTPPAANAREAAPGAAAAGGGAPSPGGLPYQLNQTAQRYPVTLYTSKDCAPCNSGRNLLSTRGVPFTEKTVESDADVQAFQRLTGSSNLPVVTVGGQRLSGFSDAEWSQYLDAAGYPKTSTLPSSYRRPAASPLVAARATPAASAPTNAASAADGAASAPAAPAMAPQRNANNPAGIRF